MTKNSKSRHLKNVHSTLLLNKNCNISLNCGKLDVTKILIFHIAGQSITFSQFLHKLYSLSSPIQPCCQSYFNNTGIFKYEPCYLQTYNFLTYFFTFSCLSNVYGYELKNKKIKIRVKLCHKLW